MSRKSTRLDSPLTAPTFTQDNRSFDSPVGIEPLRPVILGTIIDNSPCFLAGKIRHSCSTGDSGCTWYDHVIWLSNPTVRGLGRWEWKIRKRSSVLGRDIMPTLYFYALILYTRPRRRWSLRPHGRIMMPSVRNNKPSLRGTTWIMMESMKHAYNIFHFLFCFYTLIVNPGISWYDYSQKLRSEYSVYSIRWSRVSGRMHNETRRMEG